MKLTLNKLFKFLAKRWQAQPSNIQFYSDASACGFGLVDLGKPEIWINPKIDRKIYIWSPQCLQRTGVRLVESNNYLFLLPDYFPLPEGFILQEQSDES